ncbi:MAG: haloacid dehalogenase-like hydrolase [Thermoleophilaceae bacterium]
MSRSTERLVLWDIDGTLVHTAGLGRAAFAEAFEAVYGLAPELVPMAGRTDHEIALAILERNGIEQGEDHLPAFAEALADRLAAMEPEIRARGHAFPGAAEVLAELERRGVRQSLLTGNIEPNAALKLAAFGLGAELDFEIGAYGSDHRVRPELVGIARRRAREKHGMDFDVVLVGDTPLDIAAARGGGAAVVAVATGPHSVQELAAADAVLADLTDTPAAVEAILNPR